MDGRPAPARYGVAALAVAAAFVVRWAVFGEFDQRLPFAFFLPAVLLAAWYGGFGPGCAAIAAALLLGDYFFLAPHRGFGPIPLDERVGTALFAFTSLLAALLIEQLRLRIRALERRVDALLGRQRPELTIPPITRP